VVPLSDACEVVGLRTRETPRAGETWELDGRLITDDREIALSVDDFTYRLFTRSFFQVNRHLLATMLRLVRAHAERVKTHELAVDLYAGVGFFTVPLAKIFDRVIAMEGSAESAHYARLNAPSNVEVIEAPVERHSIPPAGFVFLDPPRAGARKEVISAVSSSAREMVCYLSCDPVTFSRDANRLIASGWRLSTLDLLDLFPNTHHVETLSSFERAR